MMPTYWWVAFLGATALLLGAMACLNVRWPEWVQRLGLIGVPTMTLAWVGLALVGATHD
jgi:hypothetical protein